MKLAFVALGALLVLSLTGCGGGADEIETVASSPQAQARAEAALDLSACDARAAVLGTALQVEAQCLRSSPVMRASAVPQPPGAITATLTADVFFNWAEGQYAELFAPKSQPTQKSGPYVFRHYPVTGNYLAVAGEDVFVMGPVTLGMLARVGNLSDFSCPAARIGCIGPGAPNIIGIQRVLGTSTATVHVAPPADAGSGPVTGYGVTCVPGTGPTRSASGAEGKLTLTALAPGAAYACTATVTTAFGTSAVSPSATFSMPSTASYQATKVKLVSPADDFIGAGRTYEYTRANAAIPLEINGRLLKMAVHGDQDWQAEIQLPSSMSSFVPGTYTGFVRYPFNYGAGGLSWSGEGRACNMISGSVTVHSVSYSGDAVDAINLSFEQRCDGGEPLRGTIVWGANDPTSPPGPVTPVPTNLWKPATGAVPANGNYVYTTSDAGDFVGEGKTQLFTGNEIRWVFLNFSYLSVRVQRADGSNWFDGDFLAMVGQGGLPAGYYGNLQRFPFNNPVKGGLSWFGSRGCNNLTGWFSIDEIVVEGNDLRHLLLRFEQHCEGVGPALRGQVRWTAPAG